MLFKTQFRVLNFSCEGSALSLPFKNEEFNLVISINTVHNLKIDELQKHYRKLRGFHQKIVSLQLMHIEIMKKRMENWNLTAKTIMHVEEWKKFFEDIGYTEIIIGSYHEKRYRLLKKFTM